MKKLIFTFVLFVFFANNAKAQFVEIPDSNFRKALKQRFPTCFNASNQMDTTCIEIVELETLGLYDYKISSIEGIQYFKKLKDLDCSNNNLVSLPILPNTLERLSCGNNQLNSLSSLPSSLISLSCPVNQLNSLPSLPISLKLLYCSYNRLTSIPSLPNTITSFQCHFNQITSLPSLPSSLNFFSCFENQLSSLPSLPSSLKELECYKNQLISLPELPNSLEYFNCSNNQLSSLPSLPSSVYFLSCSDNQLGSLPSLPSQLGNLNCSNNQLSNLPSLPNSLSNLNCNNNKLISLPDFPESLSFINCSNNLLTTLPSLPKEMYELNCSNNQLISLPDLSSTLIGSLDCSSNQLSIISMPSFILILKCDNNQLTSLPSLPNSFDSLTCKNNPINCLPLLPNNLKKIEIKQTNMKCLPNNPSDLVVDTILPICSNQSDVCQVQAYTKGFVYIDLNNNGIYNSQTESIIPNQIVIVSPDGWQGISDVNGAYIVKLEKGIINKWSCNSTNKYVTIKPNIYSFRPTRLGFIPNNYNFGIHFKPNIKDLEATLAGTVARPGFTTNVGVTANNIGTVNQSNITVKLKKPAGYDVLATSATPTSTLNDTLFWENVSIDFLDKKSFYVQLQVPVSAMLGDEIEYAAWVNGTQGDTTPIDNYTKWTQVLTGSYDPNDKLVSKTSLPPAYDVEKDRLIYTIRFQNTGTDTAFYVRVKDEIPANLNLSTLKVLNASHAYQLIVREKNIVEFAFPNINLPDKTTNEPKSHGFVQFSIQPKAGLPINTKIENNASIYFDYNAPIITNFATTEVKLTTGLASNKNLDFKLFPNPTNGTVRIELPYIGDGNWLLSDISGRQIKTENIASGEKIMELNLSDLPSGTYFITIQLGNNISTAKIMKM